MRKTKKLRKIEEGSKKTRDRIVDVLLRFTAKDAYESPEMKRDNELKP